MTGPDDARGGRPLTGRKVLAIAAGAFGVVFAVNGTMAFLAIDGFPGLVEKRPYVASQQFDAISKAERALGWRFATEWAAGELRVSVRDAEGAPVPGLEVSAVVGRPATAQQDVTLTLSETADGYVVPADLLVGRWRIEITARRPSDGAVYVITDALELSATEVRG